MEPGSTLITGLYVCVCVCVCAHSHLFNDYVGCCRSNCAEYDHGACGLSRTPAAHVRQALLAIPFMNSTNLPQRKDEF